MRELDELWRQYQNNRDIDWAYEKRVLVNGAEYTEAERFSFTKQGGLVFDDFTIGMCSSARFDVSLLPKSQDIPRNAKVELQMRIIGDNGITPWHTFGTYFVDSRAQEINRLTLNCYDAMRFAAGQPYIKEGETPPASPVSAQTALQKIADIIGVQLDLRNIINDITIPDPERFYMHEILSFIASAHGGNFCITDENRLRLVVPKNDAPLINITGGNREKKIDRGSKRISKLIMTISDAGDKYESGAGNTTLEIFNPIATQAIADHAYSIINGYTYNAADIQSADIDPALELGDSIAVDGTQINLWDIKYTSRIFADISAPIAGDTSSEFPFFNPIKTAVQRTAESTSKAKESADEAIEISQETFNFAQSVADSIIKIDHLPTQIEADGFPDDSAILVYDTKSPFLSVLYPVTHVFVKKADFAFVIYGNQYIVDCSVYTGSENLNFTIDWGDGAESIVNSTNVTQRTHTYATMQEWTITIKNYVSGWINFEHANNATQRNKLRKILTPFPRSETRQYFSHCFSGSTSLTEVPSDLFSQNSEVINFSGCFAECSALTHIPENLFRNNSKVGNFNNCFGWCTALTTIPTNLFINNPNVYEFEACFYMCKNMSNINLNFHPNIFSERTDFSQMFAVGSQAESHRGIAPEIWKNANAYGGGCFYNNTALTNYADIPAEWK